MNNRLKSIITVTVFAVFLLSVSVLCLAMPDTTHSDSERRELAQFPKVTTQKLVSGEFSKEFESYTTDQFPFRDALRSIKTVLAHKVLGKLDNNGLFTADGHISKLDAAINQPMMDHAAERFNYIYNTYLTDNNVYFSIVPDKNYVLAEVNGFPAMDYESFINKMAQKVPDMEYIDICDLLSSTDYYYTDTHWRQENITDIATRLAHRMGVKLTHNYTENTLDVPFYGVYAGQYAGGVVPDTIEELTTLSGVGRKTANLVCGDIYGKPAVVTDTHFIRICNRLGFIDSDNPLTVEKAMRKLLPPEKSNDFCHRTVLFGRDVCTARNAKCDICLLNDICPKKINKR